MGKQNGPIVGLTEPERRSWKAFFYASHLLMERVERALADAGVETVAEYDVLYTLHEAPDGTLTIREIAANLTLSHSGLSRLLDRLQKRGFVARCPGESDKRSVNVRLLDAGRSRVSELWALMAATISKHFAQPLTQEEHVELLRLMAKILPPLIQAKEVETQLPFLHSI